MRSSRKGKYKIEMHIPYVGKVREDTWTEIMNVRVSVCLCGLFVWSYRVSCGRGECRQDSWSSGVAASGVEGGEWGRQGMVEQVPGAGSVVGTREESRGGGNSWERKRLRRVESAGSRGSETKSRGRERGGEW